MPLVRSMRDWLWLPGDPSPLQVAIWLGLGEQGSKERETIAGAKANPLSWRLGDSGARCPFPPLSSGPAGFPHGGTWGQRPCGSCGEGTQNLQEQSLLTMGLRGSKCRDTEVPSSFVEPTAWILSLLVMG